MLHVTCSVLILDRTTLQAEQARSENCPVVLLLGWAGASHRNLSKYVEYVLTTDRGLMNLTSLFCAVPYRLPQVRRAVPGAGAADRPVHPFYPAHLSRQSSGKFTRRVINNNT